MAFFLEIHGSNLRLMPLHKRCMDLADVIAPHRTLYRCCGIADVIRL